MAQLCLGLATSHLAHIVNARNLGNPKQVAIFDAGYRRLADALANAKPDVTLIISADHVNKFFIDNMPAFGIGMFDEFRGRSSPRPGTSASPTATYQATWVSRAISSSAALTRGWTGR